MDAFKGAFGLGVKKNSLAGWEALAQHDQADITEARPSPDEPVVISDNAPSQGSKLDCLAAMLPTVPEFTYLQKLVGFAILFGGGLFMLMMCVFTLPQLFIGGASKFALYYMFMNIMVMSSTCFVVPPSKQITTLLAKDRVLITGAYFGTMALTLFVCVSIPTMFLVIPLLLTHFCTLIWYIFSYLPCGTGALNSLATSLVVSAVVPKSFQSPV